MSKEVKLSLSSNEATVAYEILHEFKIAHSGSEGPLRKMVKDCDKVIGKIEDAVLATGADDETGDGGEPDE